LIAINAKIAKDRRECCAIPEIVESAQFFILDSLAIFGGFGNF